MAAAKVHDGFAAQVKALQAEADNLARAAVGQAQRGWQTGDPGGWAGDPLDIPGLSQAWDRAAVGENYAECLSDPAAPGSTGGVLALTLQSDWMAMQERAVRVRYESSVRSALHAAARRRGHAHDMGPVRAGVLKYVEDLVKRGAG